MGRDGRESRAGRGPVGPGDKGPCPIKAAAEARRPGEGAHGQRRRQRRRGLPALGEEVRRPWGDVGAAGAGLVGQRVSRAAPEFVPHPPGRTEVWRRLGSSYQVDSVRRPGRFPRGRGGCATPGEQSDALVLVGLATSP